MSVPKIFLIPGLGADRDLFYPQKEYFGKQLHVIEEAGDESLWRKKPSMSAAADAFLKKIVPLVPEHGEFVLGWMSFGGSLAMEIARRMVSDRCCCPPLTLALVASNRTSDTISRSFHVNRLVGSIVPSSMVRRSLRGLSSLFAHREGLQLQDRRRLREMANRADLNQLMWGAKAIADWSFTDEDASGIGVPIHQIHGGHDWVIPISPRHATETLDNGRHLITWTYRDAVNTWLGNLVEVCRHPTSAT